MIRLRQYLETFPEFSRKSFSQSFFAFLVLLFLNPLWASQTAATQSTAATGTATALNPALPSPIPALERTAGQIVQALKQHRAELKTNPAFIEKTVRTYLLPEVDVTGMARSVLGSRVWNQATVAERAAFSRAFTDLVIRTYASPLAEYSDESIQFLPLRGKPAGGFASVNSTIHRPSKKDIMLTYRLVLKNGQWKIYDFSVEGVSLLQSFKTQFAAALNSNRLQEVINKMNNLKAK